MRFLKNYFLILLFVPILSFAHQPRIVSFSREDTVIKNSEVSQAFYGELAGEQKVFKLEVDSDQNFYFGLLSPDIKNTNKDFSAELFWEKDGVTETLAKLNGKEFEWKNFYEEFAGDSYWKGPENRVYVEKGDYFIKVYNPQNTGKYVLVVGEKEEFPLIEIIKTLYTLPLLKRDFWGKGLLDGYLNIFGLFFFILSFISLIVLYFVYKKIKRVK